MIDANTFILVMIMLTGFRGAISVISGALGIDMLTKYGFGHVVAGLITICFAVVMYVM